MIGREDLKEGIHVKWGSVRDGAETWCRTIRSKPVDISAQIDLDIAAFWCRVNAMSCQIECQVFSIHVRIIEAGY